MAENVDVLCEQVMANIARHINCLTEENRNTRKRAVEGIRKEIFASKQSIQPDNIQKLLDEILKPLLKLFSDPVEKCRELSITFVTEAVSKTSSPQEFLHYVIPVLVQRLGQQDIIEPSEELRLLLVQLLLQIVNEEQNKKNLTAYLDDIVRILQRTIVDPYPEVKKESCRCASAYAKCVSSHFHMQSESLIKPLVTAISHQHAKVRVEVVNAIGNVIQYGNGKSVDDVVSHLAQRLFDQSPTVRLAVIKVTGMWLLDLMDRYSFHHKLLPLLLTGITDEMPDIQQQAEDLWHDVGLKYEGENPDDLKDKQDFMKADPEHYPLKVERPNLGCRTLVYRNLSKILPGLINDLGDWVAATRIKSASLLYTLLINAEDNITQHMQKLVAGLCKACADEEKQVIHMVEKSAELIGYFVKPEIWCKLVLDAVKRSQSFGPLMVLCNVIHGTHRSDLVPFLPDISSVLVDPDICHYADDNVQLQLVRCIRYIIEVADDSCKDVSFQLFTALVSVLALSKQQQTTEMVQQTLELLSKAGGLSSKQQLYSQHTKTLVDSLQDSYATWTNHSVERLVFDTLLLESGPVVGEILEDIIPMISSNLNPDKDPEVRLKFFSLLSRLMMNAKGTLDSQQRFGDFAVVVIRDMVLPNCVWRAGRVAGAVRTTAVSCLWALLQSGMLVREKMAPVMDPLLTQMLSTLEDDNKSTRTATCQVLAQLFSSMGDLLDQDRLHNIYPNLLKRLDDSNDDIRVEVTRTFSAYFTAFKDGFNADLFRAHIEEIYKGLLVHLDDSETRIQESVLGVLKTASGIAPDVLLKEIDKAKHKHRTTKYCDILYKHIQELPK